MNKVVSEVKVLLGIKDTLQDEVLDLIVRNTSTRVNALLGTIEVPAELDYILIEVAVTRFNRLGSEGYSQDNLEGHSITFNGDDLAPYRDDINAYIKNKLNPTGTGKGRVLLL